MSSTTARHPPTAYSGPSRPHPYSRPSHRRSPPRETRDFPPSPPRSHHDAASPPMQKASVDQGDNYWDDVPPAPASLKSILDSFRRSGEGDRELLMAILQAKKSEEERLTAIIQTRLTILQARLNHLVQRFFTSPPTILLLAGDRAHSPPPPPMGYSDRERLPPLRECDTRDRDRDRRERPVSPREPAGGLEMLLEGVREAEREDRA
ncbi:hypothetical protein CcaverHIS002_0500930 [Cutaneotrichosporon cavernicola]|nr:hypothetical protein CcaverHIS002_0500930 [Cutaneotrichosporon cavernicola]